MVAASLAAVAAAATKPESIEPRLLQNRMGMTEPISAIPFFMDYKVAGLWPVPSHAATGECPGGSSPSQQSPGRISPRRAILSWLSPHWIRSN